MKLSVATKDYLKGQTIGTKASLAMLSSKDKTSDYLPVQSSSRAQAAMYNTKRRRQQMSLNQQQLQLNVSSSVVPVSSERASINFKDKKEAFNLEIPVATPSDKLANFKAPKNSLLPDTGPRFQSQLFPTLQQKKSSVLKHPKEGGRNHYFTRKEPARDSHSDFIVQLKQLGQHAAIHEREQLTPRGEAESGRGIDHLKRAQLILTKTVQPSDKPQLQRNFDYSSAGNSNVHSKRTKTKLGHSDMLIQSLSQLPRQLSSILNSNASNPTHPSSLLSSNNYDLFRTDRVQSNRQSFSLAKKPKFLGSKPATVGSITKVISSDRSIVNSRAREFNMNKNLAQVEDQMPVKLSRNKN